MHNADTAQAFTHLVQSRRSVRDFAPTPIAPAVLDAVLADANHAPSWSNTQPYRIAVASAPCAQVPSPLACAESMSV